MVRSAIVAICCAGFCLPSSAQSPVPWFAAGAHYGNCVDLDGSTENFTDPGTNVLGGCTSITFSAWCYPRTVPDATKAAGGIFMYQNAAGTIISGIYQSQRSSFTTAVFFVTTTNYSGLSALRNSLTVSNWHHVVGVWSGGQKPAICVDGVWSTNTATAISGGINQGAMPLRIGWDPMASARRFDGLIDQVALWTNRALTTNEVIELYAGGYGKPLLSNGVFSSTTSAMWQNLAELYQLDESGSSSNALDSVTQNSAAGTAIGSGDWTTGKIKLR